MRKILFAVIIFMSFYFLTSFAYAKNPFENWESSIIDSGCDGLKTPYMTKCSRIKLFGPSICKTNNSLFNEIIPNPVVYWYGTSTNNDPVLLLNFKAGIPVKWLTNGTISDLDSINLKLQLPEQYGYYYKILHIDGETQLQTITYKPERAADIKLEPSYKGMSVGAIDYNAKNALQYDVKRPIISFSGVSSDTLTIIIRRGQKYPIPNCQINVSMMVRAINSNPNCKKEADSLYEDSRKNRYDLKFNKSIVSVEKAPEFVKRLPLILKFVSVPIVTLFYPKIYDVKVLKLDCETPSSSRILEGSHLKRSCVNDTNKIIDLNNGAIQDDDILYKEMKLPYEIIDTTQANKDKKEEEKKN